MPVQPPLHGSYKAQGIEDQPNTQFGRLSDKAAETLRDAAGQAEDFTNRVVEQGREVGDRVQEVAGNFKGVVDRSVKEQPMATLAIVAVIGFVLGAVWKS
jgi:ElaB/YqjD/DUF883 family membrane-anchored ribosome-binding protein